MAVGVEIDIWQILKDLGHAATKLKDAKAQSEMNTLLAQMTGYLRDMEREVFELEEKNRHLSATKLLDFPDGHDYVVDPKHPERKLCPVCSVKNKTPTPLRQSNGLCEACLKHYR